MWGELHGPSGDAQFTTPMFPTDTLFLYEATPDTFQLMEAVVFDNTDTNALIGWVYQPRITNVYYSCLDSMNDTFNRNGYYCWNFYFDKPVRVADSFYVGASDNTGFWIDWYIERYENHIDEPLPELVYPYYGVFGTNFLVVLRNKDVALDASRHHYLVVTLCIGGSYRQHGERSNPCCLSHTVTFSYSAATSSLTFSMSSSSAPSV